MEHGYNLSTYFLMWCIMCTFTNKHISHVCTFTRSVCILNEWQLWSIQSYHCTIGQGLFEWGPIQICQPSLSFYPHPNISDRFTSHFIRVQIFQIDFPPILSSSKYFRYICWGRNEHFDSISHNHVQGQFWSYTIHIKEKGASWTLLIIITNVWLWHLVKGYLENNICYFWCPISLWKGLRMV